MNILWFSWKDSRHPEAGGAETVSEQIRQRLVRDGHAVRLITAQYPGSSSHETIDSIEIFRKGGRYSVYFAAASVYKKHMNGWEDVVIDEMNTIPFLASLYTKKDSQKILLAYQLAREVWFYQMKAPVSWLGYALEPLMLRFTATQYPLCITESISSKQDMERYGFRNVHTFRVGMELEPTETLPEKDTLQIILSLGSVRPMKRTLEAVKAFEYARDNNPSLHMIIAGDTSGSYAQNVLDHIARSRHAEDIKSVGRITTQGKLQLMRSAALILVTSIKEGWGLIVTEANSQGTPAVVYNVDGLRDSVQHEKTGIVCSENTPEVMGGHINTLLADTERYNKMRSNAWRWSHEFTFDTSYQDFLEILSENHITKKSAEVSK